MLPGSRPDSDAGLAVWRPGDDCSWSGTILACTSSWNCSPGVGPHACSARIAPAPASPGSPEPDQCSLVILGQPRSFPWTVRALAVVQRPNLESHQYPVSIRSVLRGCFLRGPTLRAISFYLARASLAGALSYFTDVACVGVRSYLLADIPHPHRLSRLCTLPCRALYLACDGTRPSRRCLGAALHNSQKCGCSHRNVRTLLLIED